MKIIKYNKNIYDFKQECHFCNIIYIFNRHEANSFKETFKKIPGLKTSKSRITIETSCPNCGTSNTLEY